MTTVGYLKRSVLVAALATAAAALWPGPAAFATPPGENGPLVVTIGGTNRGGHPDGSVNADVVTMEADGTHKVNLTHNRHSGFHNANPAWSPDGQRIAFERDPPGHHRTDIFVMGADGGNLVRLTRAREGEHNTNPSWSPTGLGLVFESDRSGAFQLYTMTSDGSLVSQLTDLPGGAWSPAWSLDGTQIAFADFSNLYVMPAIGGDPTLLSTGRYMSEPNWAPDGQRLAFSKESGVGSDVFVIDRDGTHEQLAVDASGFTSGPAWSPDGTLLAFPVGGPAPKCALLLGIATLGGDTTLLPCNGSSVRSVDWKPKPR